MGMEQEEQVEEQQPDEGSAELEAQRVAAFSAAFDGKPTEPPPATDEEMEQEQQQAAAPEAQPEQQTPKYRQITEEEFQALTAAVAKIDEIRAEQSKSFGTIGGTIRGLQERLNARQVINLPKDKLDVLRNDIPEVAELFEAVAKATAAPTFDQDAILKSAEDRLKPALDQIEERAEQRAWIRIASKQMDLLHPGWKSDAEGTEFQTFAQAQGPEFVAKLAQASNAWDYPVISDALAKWKDAKKKAATSANTRRDRMAANVTPRGSSAPANPAKTREDAFLEGWNTSP